MADDDIEQDRPEAESEEFSWSKLFQQLLSSPSVLALLGVVEQKSGEYLVKISEELSKETWRFSAEEKQVKAAFDKILSDNRSLLNQNVSSFRSFILALVGFSLTIIGFVVSGFGAAARIKHSGLTEGGLTLLAATVVLGIFDVIVIHVVENFRMESIVNAQKTALKDILLALKECHDNARPFDQYLANKMSIIEKVELTHQKIFRSKSEETPKLRKYSLAILSSSTFCLGVILIAISYLT